MKVGRNTAIAFSGILWMGVGILLLVKGFSLVLSPGVGERSGFLFFYAKKLAGNSQQAALLLICLGLFLGFLKGKMILSKTAKRVIQKIQDLPSPAPFFSLYSKSYLLLLASMMMLGFVFKWVPLSFDIKAVVDVAVGSALTNGASFYFRHLSVQKKEV